jgi:CheY-like chemotaxis protein
LYLPLTKSEPRMAAPVTLPVTPQISAYTVLVVEDEAAVRSTIRRQLETLGHTVIIADSAAAAIALLKSDAPPDVMITDVVLGSGMNGIDLADAARVFRPGLPIIFVSGFTAVPEAQQRINDSGAPLLSKPSTLSQLERAMNAVMTHSSQDTSRS